MVIEKVKKSGKIVLTRLSGISLLAGGLNAACAHSIYPATKRRLEANQHILHLVTLITEPFRPILSILSTN
jgi:hypothetical protein